MKYHPDNEPNRLLPPNLARLSNDGYVRIPLALFNTSLLRHLISGLDLEAPGKARQQSSITDISGYTEWVSESQPIITIGWDWWVDHRRKPPACLRLGAPRSNIMLLDAQNRDIGDDETADALGAAIDSMPWQAKTLKAIGFLNP